jgi:hypothetical protein
MAEANDGRRLDETLRAMGAAQERVPLELGVLHQMISWKRG